MESALPTFFLMILLWPAPPFGSGFGSGFGSLPSSPLSPSPLSSSPLSSPPLSSPPSPWVRVRRFSVPGLVASGSNASLGCDYEVGPRFLLYSLKWYKADAQFYQFIPSKNRENRKNGENGGEDNEGGAHAVFSVAGLSREQVVRGREGGLLVLVGVGVEASGVYRCELVAEGPPFHTTQRSANMTVVDVPREAPVIWVGRELHLEDEKVSLNCTAPLARPSLSLTWQVDGRQVSAEAVRREAEGEAGLTRASAALRLGVSHFGESATRVVVTCMADLADVYRRSAQVVVRRPQGDGAASASAASAKASAFLLCFASSSALRRLLT